MKRIIILSCLAFLIPCLSGYGQYYHPQAKTLIKAGRLNPQQGELNLEFFPLTKTKDQKPLPPSAVINFVIKGGGGESDGNKRIEFHQLKAVFDEQSLPSPKEIWRSYFSFEASNDIELIEFSGRNNRLMGTLRWRGVDRLIRASYQIQGERILFNFSFFPIDFAFEEGPPKELNIGGKIVFNFNLPVRYVRPSEKR